MVSPTWRLPTPRTTRRSRTSFSKENSTPMVNSSSTTPISAMSSMASWLVIRRRPKGPTSIPVRR